MAEMQIGSRDHMLLHAENNFMDAKKIWKKSDMSMFVLFDCLQSFMNKT
jgi:hypothetical protein